MHVVCCTTHGGRSARAQGALRLDAVQVLRCDDASGKCGLAYVSALRRGCPTNLRGGSHLVRAAGGLLGVGHVTRETPLTTPELRIVHNRSVVEREYDHYFYLLEVVQPVSTTNARLSTA